MSAEDLAGELRLLRQAVERQAQELAEARHALALLEDKPRAASVISKGEVKVAALGKDGFQRLLGPVESIMRRDDPRGLR